MTTPEQLAKSQQAFHKHFKDWGEFAFCQDDDGDYTEEVTIKMFTDWQAAEAFARKQALEDAIAICKNACYIYPTDEHRKSHNGGAEQCEKKLQEILK